MLKFPKQYSRKQRKRLREKQIEYDKKFRSYMPYRFISYICQNHKIPLICKIEGEKVVCPQCGVCDYDKELEKRLLAYSYSTLAVTPKTFRIM
jgi:hypothetical protein